MKWFLMSVAAGVLGLTVAATAEAGDKGGKGGGGGKSGGGNHQAHSQSHNHGQHQAHKQSHNHNHGQHHTHKQSHNKGHDYGHKHGKDGHYANGRSHGKHSRDYHLTHGHKFKHGYYYSGKGHYHWSKRYWSERYGCTVYYDQGLECDFYWCAPAKCYYPVSYCPYDRYDWDDDEDCDSCDDEKVIAVESCDCGCKTVAKPCRCTSRCKD